MQANLYTINRFNVHNERVGYVDSCVVKGAETERWFHLWRTSCCERSMVGFCAHPEPQLRTFLQTLGWLMRQLSRSPAHANASYAPEMRFALSNLSGLLNVNTKKE